MASRTTIEIGVVDSNVDVDLSNVQVVKIPPKTEQVVIEPKTTEQVITPTQDKYIDKVTVNAVTESIDSNITPTNIRKGVTILGVDGNLEPDKPDQNKSVTPTEQEQIVRADTGFELAQVTVGAIPNNYVGSGINRIKGEIITPSAEDKTIKGNSYLESDLTFKALKLQDKTVTPTESEQVVNKDAEFDGLNNVTINAIPNDYVGSAVPKVEQQTITPTTTNQEIQANQYLNGTQTILGDENLVAENIVQGKSIFGVQGSAEVVQENVEYQPNEDMQWAKQICESDVQDGFTYKVLQMIGNDFPTTDIVIPSGGAVKTSDGGYYIENTTHTWNDENARTSINYGGIKLRWLIYYYPQKETSITMLSNVMYACINGITYKNNCFEDRNLLRYFEHINDGIYIPTSANRLFENCFSLEAIPFIDTGNCTDFGSMFYYCYNLQTIPLIDTSKGTKFGSMFYYCNSIQNIPTFDVSNGESFSSMFNYCCNLQTIPLLNTSKGTNLGGMFQNCYTLKSIPKIDTHNCIYFSNMFANCKLLLSIPNLETSNGTTFENFTNYCQSLAYFPNIDTSKGTNLGNLVYYCDNLKVINELDLSSNTTSYVFQYAKNLEIVNLLNIKKSLDMHYSTKLQKDSIVNGILNNLVDLTGGTAQTLTLGSKNLAKLTEEDKAIATNKNWILK